MSAPFPKCACAHRKHQGECARPGCGCLRYRPRTPRALPRVPAIVLGSVVRELPEVAS